MVVLLRLRIHDQIEAKARSMRLIMFLIYVADSDFCDIHLRFLWTFYIHVINAFSLFYGSFFNIISFAFSILRLSRPSHALVSVHTLISSVAHRQNPQEFI